MKDKERFYNDKSNFFLFLIIIIYNNYDIIIIIVCVIKNVVLKYEVKIDGIK